MCAVYIHIYIIMHVELIMYICMEGVYIAALSILYLLDVGRIYADYLPEVCQQYKVKVSLTCC